MGLDNTGCADQVTTFVGNNGRPDVLPLDEWAATTRAHNRRQTVRRLGSRGLSLSTRPFHWPGRAHNGRLDSWPRTISASRGNAAGLAFVSTKNNVFQQAHECKMNVFSIQ